MKHMRTSRLSYIKSPWLELNSRVYIQSAQLQNGYLAFIRQCLKLVRYMLSAALEYPPGIEMVSVCTGLLEKEGRVNISVDTRL